VATGTTPPSTNEIVWEWAALCSVRLLEAAVGSGHICVMTTRSRWPLAALTGLATGAVALAGCSVGQDTHQATTATPKSVAPIPKPTNAAGPSNADDTYIQHLTDSGWDVQNLDQIIKVAHAECANLRHGTSTVDLIDQVVHQYRITGQAAVTQLVAAEAAYCPQFLGH